MTDIRATELERAPASIFGLPLKRVIVSFLLVLALGVYTGILLFGSNSLTVLLGLEEQVSIYQNRINTLKSQNAALQKEYFELKQLEPGQ